MNIWRGGGLFVFWNFFLYEIIKSHLIFIFHPSTELPTGLFLLRQITMDDFHKKLPNKKYRKFAMQALLRIFSGYFFLMNVFLVLIQANGVIEIFYDVLALQFVQQLDDIAFSLGKMCF